VLFEIVNRGNKFDPGLHDVGATATNPQGDGSLQSRCDGRGRAAR
jgi:hypothetical protein